jgi:hypothetical protein
MRTSLFDGILRRAGVRIALIAVSVVLSLIAAGLRMLPLHRTSVTMHAAAATHAPVAHATHAPAVAKPSAAPVAAAKVVAASAAAPAPRLVIGPPVPERVLIGPPAPPLESASSGVRAPAPGSLPASSSTLAHAATPAKAGTPVTAAAPGAPAGLVAKAASLAPSPIVMAPVTVNATRIPAPAAPNAAPTASAPASAPPIAGHLDERLTYQYDALGRRDPFQPLVGGGFVGADVGGDAPPDVGGIKVVGIVWGAEDQFAMVEDARGQSMVLRVGDKVQNGVVTGLKRDALIVAITVEGQTQTVTVPLTKKGDQSNANR